MDPDWMSTAAAVVSAVIAAGALIVAFRANKRADTANLRAADALDLQRRIDDRAREFTDVRWQLEVDRDWSGGRFTGVAFRNVGLTVALDVTFVIEVEGWATADVFTADEVQPGYAAGFISDATAWWMEQHESYSPLWPPFRVHWSSPLGKMQERTYKAKGIFEIG